MQAASPTRSRHRRGPITHPPAAYRRKVSTRTKLAARDPAFAPMLATLGAPPTGDGHAVEWKFDGQLDGRPSWPTTR
jgi:ATP-dependent DNA ligase